MAGQQGTLGVGWVVVKLVAVEDQQQLRRQEQPQEGGPHLGEGGHQEAARSDDLAVFHSNYTQTGLLPLIRSWSWSRYSQVGMKFLREMTL
jgi:hypothetical protein